MWHQVSLLNLFTFLLIACPVVQEQQYEVIVVPTLLVGLFLILLAVILWLFMREQRSQQQRPGLQGKTQSLGISRGTGKMDIRKNVSLISTDSSPGI